MKTLIILLAFLFLNGSCKKEKTMDDVLSLTKQNYTGNQFRTDGYYYEKYGSPERATILFFYNNGILLEGGSPLTTEISQKEQEYQDGTYYSYAQHDKLSWGLFTINGNEIKFEKWYPSSDGILPAYVRSGSIVNDSTFIISESYRIKNGQKTEISTKNETYKFKAFSPKPDSTNTFVQ